MAQSALERAKAAYAERDWVSARNRFEQAHAEAPLGADDLAALADCSWWLGDIDQCLPVQHEVYRLHVEAGRAADAALMALEIAYALSLRGEQAQASGWMSRGARHLADQPEGPAHGYFGYIAFEEAFWGGDLATALAQADEVHALGARHGDANLVALGVLGRGRVLVKQGRLAEGMALLDEAMLAATSEELAPGWAGNIYCHLMFACFEIADLRRAGEWTEATVSWCERMPGAGPFLGICRVHRAQLLVVHGAWADAEREVALVRDTFAHFNVEIVAESHYQLGELRRRRGDFDAAESSYRQAHALGRDPQPGLALLRLAQGRVRSAESAIRLALVGAEGDRLQRAALLAPAADIALEAGDLDAARDVAAELEATSAEFGTDGLHAPACHVRGAVLLAGGAPAEAVARLREALRLWQGLHAPYEVARVRLLLAEACTALGDGDAAALELEAAKAELDGLGADPDVAAGGLARALATRGARADGLTSREAEILDLLGSGLTNQQIADRLVLSVRTVERHLATVYGKLGLQGRNARAAAVRYALGESATQPAPGGSA